MSFGVRLWRCGKYCVLQEDARFFCVSYLPYRCMKHHTKMKLLKLCTVEQQGSAEPKLGSTPLAMPFSPMPRNDARTTYFPLERPRVQVEVRSNLAKRYSRGSIYPTSLSSQKLNLDGLEAGAFSPNTRQIAM